jgi:hypothetical protein
LSTTPEREHTPGRARSEDLSAGEHDHHAHPAPVTSPAAASALLAGTVEPSRFAVRRLHGAGEDVLGGSAVPADVDAVLRRRRGAGSPLPSRTAEEMGAGFGADFSGVRVHTDSEAAGVAQRLQAQAFSYGSDLYFGTGTYRPESGSGRELIAHELAHVVQAQSGRGAASAGTTVGRADDPAEREADSMAAGALRRRLAATSPASVQAAVGEVLGGTITGFGSLRRRVVDVIRRAWTSKRNLSDHYQKHGGEYSGLSESEYAQVAEDTRASGEHHVTQDGKHYYYNRATNDFAAFTPDGKAMTVFKPGRRGYWNTKKQE